MANHLYNLIVEGQAHLHIPKSVFYNPVQEFNRDLSIIVLKTYLKHDLWRHKRAKNGVRILDALSASGLRSIRFAKELAPHIDVVNKIVANDLSSAAVDLIKNNVALNKVEDKVSVSHSDAALLMHTSASPEKCFHVIDLDPFGTAAPFIDPAVSCIDNAGLLMVTCTDTAVLCGNASEACFARYGSMSVKADFCHENALRMVLRSIEARAAVHGKYIKPLLSISADFYIRLFVQIFSQQAETKKSASRVSQLFLCKECRTHNLNRLGEYNLKEDPKQASSENAAVKYKFKPPEFSLSNRCEICRGALTIAGPIWSEPIHDRQFLGLLKQELNEEQTRKDFATSKRIQGVVYVCSEELEVPLFHSIKNMSSILRCPMPPTKDLMSALYNAGYKSSATHTNKVGLKTNASNTVIWDIFCQYARARNIVVPPNSLAERIMSRSHEQVYDFTYNPKVEVESQRMSLVRFHVNPTPEWGPKSRPTGVVKPEELNDVAGLQLVDVGVDKSTDLQHSGDDEISHKKRKFSDSNKLDTDQS